MLDLQKPAQSVLLRVIVRGIDSGGVRVGSIKAAGVGVEGASESLRYVLASGLFVSLGAVDPTPVSPAWRKRSVTVAGVAAT